MNTPGRLYSIAVAAILIATAVTAASAGPPEMKPRPEVELQVTASAPTDVDEDRDHENTNLEFVVKNVGTTDVVRGELGINTNKICILGPRGAVTMQQMIVDVFDRNYHPPVIRPGESVTWDWKWPIGRMDEGSYRLYWDFGGVRSNELKLVIDHAPPPENPPQPDWRVWPTHNQATPVDAVKMLLNGLDGDLGSIGVLTYLGKRRSDPPGLQTDLERKVAGLVVRRSMKTGSLRSAITDKFGKAIGKEWRNAGTDIVIKEIERAAIIYPPYFDEALMTGNG